MNIGSGELPSSKPVEVKAGGATLTPDLAPASEPTRSWLSAIGAKPLAALRGLFEKRNLPREGLVIEAGFQVDTPEATVAAIQSEVEAGIEENGKAFLLTRACGLAPDNSLVTGSIALAYQEGTPIEQAIAQAGDIDLLVNPNDLHAENIDQLKVLAEQNPTTLELQMNMNAPTEEQMRRSVPAVVEGTDIHLMHVNDLLTSSLNSLELMIQSPAHRKHNHAGFVKHVRRVERILAHDWKGEIEEAALASARHIVSQANIA